MEAAADNDYPTVEERANAKDWQREFPGDQAHQDRTVAEIIRAHRQAVYVLLDEAAAVGVPTSEDREILRLLSTVEVAWHLSDRIVFLAEKWAGSALPEGSAPVILVPLTDESSSRASEIGALIEQGEDLLVTARRDDNVGEDLGMEVGDWVNRSRAKVPDEFLPLYERAFSKQGGSESGLGQPWQPTTEIERCLEELCEIRQRIES